MRLVRGAEFAGALRPHVFGVGSRQDWIVAGNFVNSKAAALSAASPQRSDGGRTNRSISPLTGVARVVEISCASGFRNGCVRRLMRMWLRLLIVAMCVPVSLAVASDAALTPPEKAAGWISLFDGKTLDGWVTSNRSPSKRPVEEGSLNPHKCGAYMLMYDKPWGDFVLALDFKISKGCNSGIFLRTFPLEPRPGKDVGYNGIEVAVDDTPSAGFHDTGAIYDLVKPTRMR